MHFDRVPSLLITTASFAARVPDTVPVISGAADIVVHPNAPDPSVFKI